MISYRYTTEITNANLRLSQPSRRPKSPGLSLRCRSSSVLQMVVARLRSGHLHVMTFVQGESFFTSPSSHAPLLDFWGISLEQLFGDQDLVCDILMRKGQMDMV
ncbi:uncharacterized protein TNCV_793811 [Trichonephila clavipes]|nr:uncharacterized protein TNCV_793811 [Trichonephila clavipes]